MDRSMWLVAILQKCIYFGLGTDYKILQTTEIFTYCFTVEIKKKIFTLKMSRILVVLKIHS